MNRFLFSISCFLITTFAHAQMEVIERMEAKHEQEVKMYELVNESNRLINADLNSAIEKVQEALTISFSIKNKRGEGFSYQTLGVVFYQKQNYAEAIGYYEKAKAIFKQLDDKVAYFKTVKYLAQAYEANKAYTLAEKEYQEYLELALAKKMGKEEVFAKESIGRVMFNSKKYKEANGIYQQLLVMYRAANDDVNISNTYEYIGKCYAGLKDTTNAYKYLELAGVLSEKYASAEDQSTSWENVGRSYNSMGKYDKSVEYEKKAKVINKRNGDAKRVYLNNSNLASDYLFMNKANEAIPLLNENIDLSTEMGELKNTGETYRALSDAYVQLGKIEEAKKSFEQYKAVQETLLEEKAMQLEQAVVDNTIFTDKEKQIELLIKDRELDEKQIELLKAEQQQEVKNLSQQRKISYLMGGLVLLLLIGLVFFYRSSKQKQLANKLLSIRSLRSQMNPHFIFNSLNSVNSFISKSDERSANKYLTEFARLMRTVLEHSKRDFVPLHAEIEVLERYLSLEHIRFHDHFDYTFEVDDLLDTERLMIPPMLVQPYVENAIWHGLRYKEEKGVLHLRFKDMGQGIEIEIVDDGIGRTKSKEIKTKNQKMGKSTGISNTSARLNLLNDVHNIQIKNAIEDLNPDGTGTRVRIEIPYVDVDEKKYAESF